MPASIRKSAMILISTPKRTERGRNWSRRALTNRQRPALIADDFANSDHPGVTAAAPRFEKQRRAECEAHDCDDSILHKPLERLLPSPLGPALWVKR